MTLTEDKLSTFVAQSRGIISIKPQTHIAHPSGSDSLASYSYAAEQDKAEESGMTRTRHGLKQHHKEEGHHIQEYRHVDANSDDEGSNRSGNSEEEVEEEYGDNEFEGDEYDD